MSNKCMECTEDALSKLSSCIIERDKYKKWYELVCKCLDIKDELCKELRNENKDLTYKLELFQEKRNK